ncbi:MAG: molybdopterin-dependent oxidoreductase [Clostridiales Family XIII bacterium]|jgi:trimethylamine-N-oxide reductase (cytochrome c)|nr:molybdopterin-dependent oxidoreductase [Clostridiales Family XIII bacterium]
MSTNKVEGSVLTASSGKDKPAVGADKTVIKALGLSGGIFGASPCSVDVKDGKVIRIRPLHFDSKYDSESFNPWKMERNGTVFEPLMKTTPAPWSLAYKKRTYSPNRVMYPMKRVDWDPNGERNTQNRGKSKFVRISWDEATDLIAAEIRRVHKEYGPLAILVQGDGHGECKMIHAPHGCATLLFDKMGGFTQQVRNPDSWEGWYWGAKHVWGKGFIGMMAPADNVVKDISEHSDMVVVWGGDPETTHWGFRGQLASRLLYFWSEIGIKQVYICPDLNYSAAIHADKWIPVLPNTDAALQLAIIYQWIVEGTYDKEYVATHTVGFDKIKSYVLGEADGIVKTPKWASEKCGVPSYTIKALARDWAEKIVTIGHYFAGGMARGPYSHEPARLECILLGMQGLGKPGVHQAQIAYTGMPKNIIAGGKDHMGTFGNLEGTPAGDRILKPHRGTPTAWGKQMIPKTLIEEAIKKGTVDFYGTGGHEEPTSDQYKKYTYPIPAEEGGTEIHMMWTDTPCRQTCWNCGNDVAETSRNSKIECIVAQHPWLENDCLFADIVLPTNTTLEVDDISPCLRDGDSFQSVLLMRKAVEPIGESKSDYEAIVEVAKKLGLEKEVTEGFTVDELIKETYKGMRFDQIVSWDEFQEKDYFVIPVSKDWEKHPAGLYEFYSDPEANPLPTPTGKLEFYSESLAQAFPNDEERPPYPMWIEKGISHDERLSSKRAQAYPLLVLSNHGRWRVHAQADDIPWSKEAVTGKVRGFDGYLYEPCWLNPADAAARKIKNGDIIRVYNERGSVLCGALVFERVMSGAVSIDHGARADYIIPGKLDRGGAINTITPEALTSRHAAGQATTSFLVEVERVSMAQLDQWRTENPEAFERAYDAASGLRFNGWIEGGNR